MNFEGLTPIFFKEDDECQENRPDPQPSLMGGREGVTHRILITLRFRVRHGREIRRVKGKSVIGFKGKSVPKIRRVL